MGDDRSLDIKRLYRVARLGITGLTRSQIPRMAAALSYRTIFSVIPVMALGLLIFGSFVEEEDVDAGVRRVLEFAGVSQIGAATAPPTQEQPLPNDVDSATETQDNEITIPETVPDLTENISEDAPQDAPEESAANELEGVITDLINRVNTSIRNVPTGWIAIASVVVLLYAAMSMLIEIEKSFNQLTSAPSGRPWLRRLMLYWTMLTLGTLLLAATFLAGDALATWIRDFSGGSSAIGAALAGFGVSVLIATILFFAFYLTIPNTKMKLRPALAGAFLAAVLWEIGKAAFTLYLREATGYTKFYGSLAILPLFMLWVYLTWVIVLLGMQTAHALQHFKRLVDSGLEGLTSDEKDRGPVVIDPLVVVGVGVSIARAYTRGARVTADSVAKWTDIDASLASRLLITLERRAVVTKVATGEDDDETYILARPADKVMVSELVDAGYELDRFRAASGVQIPDRLLGAVRATASEMSLASLIKDDQTDPTPQNNPQDTHE